MADRLTPEQLDKVATTMDQVRALVTDELDQMRLIEVSTIARQAARDARTLARVQAWTEEELPTHIQTGAYRIKRNVLSRAADQQARQAVAALLRTEEES